MPLFRTQPIQKVLKTCANRHLIMTAGELSYIQDHIMTLENHPEWFEIVSNNLSQNYKVAVHLNADKIYSISSLLHKDDKTQRVRVAICISQLALNKVKEK